MNARILVVDDNAANLELMVYLLEAFGHSAKGFGSAGEALRHAGDHYDVVLTDIRMPQMDGYEFARRVRAIDSTASIVAVTAHAMVGDKERIIAAGFDGYISKPIEPERFVSQVEAFLPSGSRGERS